MDAIILAGGKGTRLAHLYPDQPKALAPVAGKPFIEWQMEWLAAGGAKSVHVAAGHMGDQIETWAKTFHMAGVRISVSREPTPLGTGGGLKFALPFVSSPTVLVLNGDSILPSLKFTDMRAAFESARGVQAMLAVTSIQAPDRYGVVEIAADNRISAFCEKEHRTSGWINAGVYMLWREMVERIDAWRHISLETEVFPAAAARGALRAFKSAPPLLDMGTPDGLRAAAAFLAAYPIARPDGPALAGAPGPAHAQVRSTTGQ